MLVEWESLRHENMRHYGFGPEVMRSQKVCKACGRVNNAERDYCTDCGTVLPFATLYDIYRMFHLSCPKCHQTVSVSYQFCPSCGKRLRQRKRFALW